MTGDIPRELGPIDERTPAARPPRLRLPLVRPHGAARAHLHVGRQWALPLQQGTSSIAMHMYFSSVCSLPSLWPANLEARVTCIPAFPLSHACMCMKMGQATWNPAYQYLTLGVSTNLFANSSFTCVISIPAAAGLRLPAAGLTVRHRSPPPLPLPVHSTHTYMYNLQCGSSAIAYTRA